MILVIDASVAVKWFIEEDRCELARDVFREGIELVAPDLIFTEVANAMRKKVRDGEVAMEQARNALTGLANLFNRLVGPRDILVQSFEFACEIRHAVPDCVYLACASIAGAALLTDDETLFLKAGALKTAVKAMRLRDWTPGLLAK